MRLRITLENRSYDVSVEILPEPALEALDAPVQEDPVAEVPESVLQPPHLLDTMPEDKICHSPIAGIVIAIAASPGRTIRQDDPVVTIEAMKMQNTIGAPMDGVVEEVLVKLGDSVKTGQVLCRLS